MGFTLLRLGCRWVHPDSLCALGIIRCGHWDSPGFTLGVVGFIRGRGVHSGWLCVSLVLSGVVGFIRGLWVHSGSHWGSFVSSGIVGWRNGDRLVYPRSLDTPGFVIRWVHPGSFGSHALPWVSLGSLVLVGFTRVRSADLWVHPETLSSFGCALGVIGFIRGGWVHSGKPWESLGSSGVVGFTRVRPGVRCVHLESLG